MANVEVCYTVYLASAVGFFLNKIHRVLVSLEFLFKAVTLELKCFDNIVRQFF